MAFNSIIIEFHDYDTRFEFSAWTEVNGYIEIGYKEYDSGTYVHKFNLPTMNQKEWEEFKKAGDIAFEMMEK